MTFAAVLVVAYLLGSIPTSYIVVYRLTGRDIRSMGSGNPGTMNVLDTVGWGAADAKDSSGASPGSGYGVDPDLLRDYKPGDLWPLTFDDLPMTGAACALPGAQARASRSARRPPGTAAIAPARKSRCIAASSRFASCARSP